jgi:hypothetical protein
MDFVSKVDAPLCGAQAIETALQSSYILHKGTNEIELISETSPGIVQRSPSVISGGSLVRILRSLARPVCLSRSRMQDEIYPRIRRRRSRKIAAMMSQPTRICWTYPPTSSRSMELDSIVTNRAPITTAPMPPTPP